MRKVNKLKLIISKTNMFEFKIGRAKMTINDSDSTKTAYSTIKNTFSAKLIIYSVDYFVVYNRKQCLGLNYSVAEVNS